MSPTNKKRIVRATKLQSTRRKTNGKAEQHHRDNNRETMNVEQRNDKDMMGEREVSWSIEDGNQDVAVERKKAEITKAAMEQLKVEAEAIIDLDVLLSHTKICKERGDQERTQCNTQ